MNNEAENGPVGTDGDGYYWLDMRGVPWIMQGNKKWPQPAAWSLKRGSWRILASDEDFPPYELRGAKVLGKMVPPEYP